MDKPRVKLLVWDVVHPVLHHSARNILGKYICSKTNNAHNDRYMVTYLTPTASSETIGYIDGIEAAKAAAQADYEARILAAIEPAPVTKNRPPASADWMDGPGTGPAPVSVREAAIDTAASKALFGYMDRSDRYSCGVQAGVSRMCAALRAIAEGKE